MNSFFFALLIISLILVIVYLIFRSKRMKGKIIYLETSAINHLAEISSEPDAIATRQYHNEKGNKLMVSVVSIWEVLMTSNEIEREKLVFYMQNALYPKLIFSPSELIINFIKAGCPEYEPKKSIFTKLPIGDTWEDICQDNRKTFNFDTEDLKKRTKSIQRLFKRVDRAILDTVVEKKLSGSELKELADSIYNNLNLSRDNNNNKDSEKIFKLAIIFISVILCAGIQLDNTPIEKFWEKLRISDIEKRITYIFNHYEILVHRGPFLSMALMAYNQIVEDKKPNRGLFWDALHSLYLPYIDILLTKDKHFKELQKKVNHINFSKIKLIENGIIKRRKVNIKNKK